MLIHWTINNSGYLYKSACGIVRNTLKGDNYTGAKRSKFREALKTRDRFWVCQHCKKAFEKDEKLRKERKK